ncbi:MAG: hypothetical protein QUV35_12910 [Hydrogenophaga sp.]|uniref:hypothetical protein n=1 Tax=Hydrogenophaga sp. TaxID=1904254 RepID=UPI00260B6623|nr:hypothetical protein [Hydrogenophaga sp.]MDM7943517.1 hypothetical protein [Hydrogenophaga sp.]
MAVEVPILVNNGMQPARAIPLEVPVADPWFRRQIKPVERGIALPPRHGGPEENLE